LFRIHDEAQVAEDAILVMEHAENHQLFPNALPDRIGTPVIAALIAVSGKEMPGFGKGKRDGGRLCFQPALVGRANGLTDQATGQAGQLPGKPVTDRRQFAGILSEQRKAFLGMEQETFPIDGLSGAAPDTGRAAGTVGQLRAVASTKNAWTNMPGLRISFHLGLD
jgi:hypothetical protein